MRSSAQKVDRGRQAPLEATQAQAQGAAAAQQQQRQHRRSCARKRWRPSRADAAPSAVPRRPATGHAQVLWGTSGAEELHMQQQHAAQQHAAFMRDPAQPPQRTVRRAAPAGGLPVLRRSPHAAAGAAAAGGDVRVLPAARPHVIPRGCGRASLASVRALCALAVASVRCRLLSKGTQRRPQGPAHRCGSRCRERGGMKARWAHKVPARQDEAAEAAGIAASAPDLRSQQRGSHAEARWRKELDVSGSRESAQRAGITKHAGSQRRSFGHRRHAESVLPGGQRRARLGAQGAGPRTTSAVRPPRAS
jgi:hypothetical protein